MIQFDAGVDNVYVDALAVGAIGVLVEVVEGELVLRGKRRSNTLWVKLKRDRKR